jgi:hypothetical protein
MKAALKESDIVEKVASIMNKYFPSSEETSLLQFSITSVGGKELQFSKTTMGGNRDWWERLQ